MTEPEATFSACFGGAFLMWHPMKYASMLADKMAEHGTRAWLVNTGWTGGKCALCHQQRTCIWGCCVQNIMHSSFTSPQNPLLTILLHADCSLHTLPSAYLIRNWLVNFEPPMNIALARRYGVGSRIKLRYTRAIIDAIHSGELATADVVPTPIFALQVGPLSCPCSVPLLLSMY